MPINSNTEEIGILKGHLLVLAKIFLAGRARSNISTEAQDMVCELEAMGILLMDPVDPDRIIGPINPEFKKF